jgi:hypothetical protein
MSKLYRFIVSLILAGVATNLHAFAGDYPFRGFYRSGFQPSQATAENIRIGCALGFQEQRPDGNYAGYRIDLEAFRTKNEIKYVKTYSGTCKFDETSRIETCETLVNVLAKEEEGRKIYLVLGDVQDSKIAEYYFEDLSQAEAAVKSGNPATIGIPEISYSCPSSDRLKTYLSNDFVTASQASEDPQIGSEDFLKSGLMLELVRKLSGG